MSHSLRPSRRLSALLACAVLAPLQLGCAPILSLFANNSYQHQLDRETALREAADKAARERRNETSADRMRDADRMRLAGRVDSAAMGYLEAYRRDPANPLPQERMGFLQLSHDPMRAEAIFTLLVEQNPERASIRAGLGLAHLAQGRLAPAHRELARAVELAPDDVLALNALAVVQDLEGNSAEAQQTLKRVEALQPQDARVANNLGVSHLMLGDYPAAESALRRAVLLEPRDAAAWNNLGLALGQQDRYAEAFEAFRKAGDEQAAENNLGYVYFLKGRYDDAVSHYERALLRSGGEKVRVLQNLQAALEARERAAQPAQPSLPASPASE